MIHPPRDMVTMVGMLRTADHKPPTTKAEPPRSYMHGTERCIHCRTLIGRTSLRFSWFHVGTGDEQCRTIPKHTPTTRRATHE